MNKLIQQLIYPSFLFLGALFLWFLQKQFPSLSLSILTSIGVFFSIILCVVLEKYFVYRKDWSQTIENDTRFDLYCNFVLFPIVVGGCKYISLNFPSNFKILNLMELPILAQAIISLLVGEFLFYWYHRISHTNEFLWKFHSVHHSVKRVYWMNAGTFSVIDLSLNFSLYCVPFIFFQLDPSIVEYVIYFSAVTGLLEHANVRFDAGFLNCIFNTAQLHRWHHSVVVKESQTNYGKALIIWDLIFKSYYLPKNILVKEVGVD